MNDSKKMLGERLRAARERKGLKQNRVALSLGIHNSTLAKYESGEREPDNDTLQKLADFFDVTVDYLLGRDKQVEEIGLRDVVPKLKKYEEIYGPLSENEDENYSSSDKKEVPNEQANIFYREWDKLTPERRKQAIDFLKYLNQLADEENNKKK